MNEKGRVTEVWQDKAMNCNGRAYYDSMETFISNCGVFRLFSLVKIVWNWCC